VTKNLVTSHGLPVLNSFSTTSLQQLISKSLVQFVSAPLRVALAAVAGLLAEDSLYQATQDVGFT